MNPYLISEFHFKVHMIELPSVPFTEIAAFWKGLNILTNEIIFNGGFLGLKIGGREFLG